MAHASASQPSLALTLGGAGPEGAHSGEGADRRRGAAGFVDGGRRRVEPAWPPGPVPAGPAKAAEASYDTCPAATPSGAADGGASPFASLEPRLVCSGLVAAGTGSVRVAGLENGRTYRIAVVAVGVDGTPSAPSVEAEGTPGVTVVSTSSMSRAAARPRWVCAAGGGTRDAAGGAALVAGVALVACAARRRRRGTMLVVAAGLALSANEARATLESPSAFAESIEARPEATESPRLWNVELRFGPYLPEVDEEFIARGDPARPFADIFSSSQRLMSQLEIDRQLLHRGGIWSLGVGVGYYPRDGGGRLTGDLKARSATRRRCGSCRSPPPSSTGRHAAQPAGVALGPVRQGRPGLHAVERERHLEGQRGGPHVRLARRSRRDAGPGDVRSPNRRARCTWKWASNQTALFFEVTRYSLNGFGSRSALRVGDTTWFAGLMFEL